MSTGLFPEAPISRTILFGIWK